MTYSVWAPHRENVRLWLDGRLHDMHRDERGWWHAGVSGGTDYAFQLDDEPRPLPDPRSRWQPNGVHEPSRRYEHSAFDWTDQRWHGRQLAGSVLYELHLGTFTEPGTFDAAIEKLDHLVSLGIDVVELLPVNSFDGTVGWGYDGVAWGAVHEPYGGPDGMKRFVDACHARGISVALDVVYNHLGPSGAYLDRFGPYFAGRNIWGPTVNLDGPDSDEVRRLVIDNALSWFRDFHVDALRLDAVHALVDHRAIHVLEQLATEVDSLSAGLGRPLTLIAESDLNDPKLVTSRDAGGYGLAAQWSDDLHHALHYRVTGERQGYYTDFAVPEALATTLRRVFFHADTWSSFRQRHHGRPVNTARTPGHRFLAYLQNHDQIGNRATGDRLSATVSPRLLGTAAAIVFGSPFTPMVFMGEEWAASTPWQFFSSFPDPDLAEAVRKGRIEEFAEHGWGEAEVPDPTDPATFRRSKLDWSELRNSLHSTMFALYRDLIALRRTRHELADPALDDFVVESARDWLVLHRGSLRVVANFGSSDALVPIAAQELLLTNGTVRLAEDHLTVSAESFAIVTT
jgi:maltooligosyltrehalose trehalohydrolase